MFGEFDVDWDRMVVDPDSDSSDGEVSGPETDIAAQPHLPLAPAPSPQTAEQPNVTPPVAAQPELPLTPAPSPLTAEQPKVTPPPTTEQLTVTSARGRVRAPWRSAPVIELRARASWRGASVIKRRRGKRGGQGRRQTRDRLRIDVALAAAPWRRGGVSGHGSSS
jgi:hypothetical protein